MCIIIIHLIKCALFIVGRSDGFTVDADGAGDQGTLPLPKLNPKDSWTTNTNKVHGGW